VKYVTIYVTIIIIIIAIGIAIGIVVVLVMLTYLCYLVLPVYLASSLHCTTLTLPIHLPI
jgi:hypothetical protein